MDTTTRYNLNDPYNLSTYYTDEEIQAMDEKTKSEAWYKMWRNFCVSDSYEPGSPQKAFTVAGAIEEGAISGNEVFECGGKLHFGDWDIRCVARSRSRPLTITQGLMKSCNVVMMRIVSLEGKEKFVQYQKIFGFGEKTGIDLPGEASGLIYQASNMDPASLATNAFGQNYNCTMVQMAAGYASLINGGSYYEPHVVKEILNDEGSVVKSVSPNLVRRRFRNRPRTSLIMRFTRQYQVMAVPRARRQLLVTKWLVRQVRRRSSRVRRRIIWFPLSDMHRHTIRRCSAMW